jgi:hypothetical protein
MNASIDVSKKFLISSDSHFVVESFDVFDVWKLDRSFIVHWLVDLMTDEFEDVTEGFLILSSLDAFSQFKIDFSEVHSNCLRDHSFKECICEVESKSVTFICAS